MSMSSNCVIQGVKKVTAQTAFSELRKHLTRATVAFDYSFKEYSETELKVRENEVSTEIDAKEPFQMLIFEEIEAVDADITSDDDSKVEDVSGFAAQFCRDGQRWI